MVLDVGSVSLNQYLAKYGEGVAPILASCMVNGTSCIFLLFRGQYNVPLRTGRQQLIPVIF